MKRLGNSIFGGKGGWTYLWKGLDGTSGVQIYLSERPGMGQEPNTSLNYPESPRASGGSTNLLHQQIEVHLTQHPLSLFHNLSNEGMEML